MFDASLLLLQCMSMKFAPLIDPAVRKPAPKPVRVDLRKVFAIGTGLWIVALIVVLILLAVGYSVCRW